MDLTRLLVTFTILGAAESTFDIEFITDFFQDKDSLITLHNCWDHNKNKQLMLNSKKRIKVINDDGIDVGFLKKYTLHHTLVLDFRNCPQSITILNKVNDTMVFDYPLKHLMLVDKEQFPSYSIMLEKYQILPSCDFILAVFNQEVVTLHQIYKPGKNEILVWENYGHWSYNTSLTENFWDKTMTSRRLDLRGTKLVISFVVFDNDSINHLSDFMYPEFDTFTKQDYEPAMCLAQVINATPVRKFMNSYGYLDHKTGTWDGMIKAIVERDVDYSGTALYFTEDRFQVVDFVKQGISHPIRFVVRKPAMSFVKNIFYLTFNTSVWVASLVVMVVSAVVVKVILNWEAKTKTNVNQNYYNTSDVALITLEAVCQQGTVTEPKSFSGRILTLIFFGAFMFIYVSYSANIVVLLQSTTKIKNAEELLRSRIAVGGQDLSYMQKYFESVTSGPLKKLYDTKIYPDQYFSLDKGLKKVQFENFAFHVSLIPARLYILKHFTNYEICGLQELPGYIERSIGYVGLRKFSPYKDIFKVGMLRVAEYGLQKRSDQRISMSPKCYSQGASFKSIGFYDCEKVIYIWLYGISLSVGILLVEIVVNMIVLRKKLEMKQTQNSN